MYCSSLFPILTHTSHIHHIKHHRSQRPTRQDVLQHAGEGVLCPGSAPGDVPPVEVCPHQEEQQTLQLVLRYHLTEVDGGPRGIGYPGQHLQRGGHAHSLFMGDGEQVNCCFPEIYTQQRGFIS